MDASPDSNLRNLVNEIRGTVSRVFIDLIRARQKIYALEAESRLRTKGRLPRFPIEFTSQFGEDLLAWDLFAGQTEGFYIEAGAFDGYHYSVTYPLEAIGWTGLLVEPHPHVVQQCARRRPNSMVVYAALGGRGSTGTAEFTIVEDRYGGMLSHLSQARALPNIDEFRHASVSVPITSLDQLLMNHPGEVDLVALDVEGAEVNVLEGFDLKRFRPRLLLIESNDAQSVSNFMAQFRYVNAGQYESNLIFIRDDQKEMMDRLRWLKVI